MTLLRYAMLATVLTAVVMSVSFFTSLFAQQGVPDDPRPAATSPEELPPVPESAVEVQTSGPIHEGFASPLSTEMPESIVVNKLPPQNIEELPPEQRPQGDNIVWIPGYFGWDEDRKDFIWMSGFWRDVPPGRAWVSGYWSQNAEGWQWVPGFWTSAEQDEVTYLPPPPETVEAGPSIAQPSVNHFWVPGHWHWIDTHYAWRPGYWSRIHPDWMWIPAHYVWCPNGYVFVDGYWDYPVHRRGLLFAPAYFQPVVYRRPYYFTPSIVWSTHLLTSHLWVRPSYHHYYFGDFYHDRYANWGIRPWHLSFTFGRTSYDPLFSYYRWYYRDRDWTAHVHDRYDYYRRNEDRRPPRTYRDLQQVVARGGNREALRDLTVAAPITQIVNNTTVNNVSSADIRANFDTPFRFDRMAQSERRQAARQAQELRGVVGQRRQLETRDNSARVEGGRREGAKSGEDTRIRQVAPRRLNVGDVAQAIGATPDRRGPGATTRRRGDGQATRKTGDSEPVAGRARNGRGAKEREDATTGARTRPRPGRETESPAPDIARPDRGPALGAPDIARPGVTDTDAARPGRGRVEGDRSEIARPGRGPAPGAPDVARPGLTDTDASPGRPRAGGDRPDIARPDASLESRVRDTARGLRGRNGATDATGRNRALSPENGRSDATRPNIVRPDSRGERPTTRGARPNRPELPTLPGDVPNLSRPERASEPLPRRGIDPPQRGGATPRAIDRSPERTSTPRNRPTPPGLGDPSALTPRPRTSGRESAVPPNRERLPQTSAPRSSPRPDLSGMTGQLQSRSRESRPDPVTPLRLGGPQPSPRAAPTPRAEPRPSAAVPRAEPRVARPAPRASAPSASAPTGTPRPRDRARGRDQD